VATLVARKTNKAMAVRHGEVWQNLRLAGIWSQAVGIVLVRLAGIWLQSPLIYFTNKCMYSYFQHDLQR
jgi:hypothetical protein